MLTVLFSIPQLPFNARLVLVTVSKIVAFELIPTEEIYAEIFGFEETPSVNQIFEDAKFDGSNFFQLLGLIFSIQVVYGLYMALHALGRYIVEKANIQNATIRKYTMRVQHKVVVIRFFLESCVEISIASLIAIQFVSKLKLTNV